MHKADSNSEVYTVHTTKRVHFSCDVTELARRPIIFFIILLLFFSELANGRAHNLSLTDA